MIDTGAGVIDADYRGVVFVLLFNHSDKDFEGKLPFFLGSCICHLTLGVYTVQEGDRIAQLILEKIYTPEVREVEVSLVHTLLMPPNWKLLL
jgi:dUTP pyrophosphatase